MFDCRIHIEWFLLKTTTLLLVLINMFKKKVLSIIEDIIKGNIMIMIINIRLSDTRQYKNSFFFFASGKTGLGFELFDLLVDVRNDQQRVERLVVTTNRPSGPVDEKLFKVPPEQNI